MNKKCGYYEKIITKDYVSKKICLSLSMKSNTIL